LDILQLMIESYGTKLFYKLSNDVIFNPFACAIRANHLDLLDYLMEKYFLESN
jgi:hypothetical protein